MQPAMIVLYVLTSMILNGVVHTTEIYHAARPHSQLSICGFTIELVSYSNAFAKLSLEQECTTAAEVNLVVASDVGSVWP